MLYLEFCKCAILSQLYSIIRTLFILSLPVAYIGLLQDQKESLQSRYKRRNSLHPSLNDPSISAVHMLINNPTQCNCCAQFPYVLVTSSNSQHHTANMESGNNIHSSQSNSLHAHPCGNHGTHTLSSYIKTSEGDSPLLAALRETIKRAQSQYFPNISPYHNAPAPRRHTYRCL